MFIWECNQTFFTEKVWLLWHWKLALAGISWRYISLLLLFSRLPVSCLEGCLSNLLIIIIKCDNKWAFLCTFSWLRALTSVQDMRLSLNVQLLYSCNVVVSTHQDLLLKIFNGLILSLWELLEDVRRKHSTLFGSLWTWIDQCSRP